MKKFSRNLQLGVLSIASISLTSCFDDVVYLDQNWNEDNQLRTLSYSTSQGSQLIPYNWYLNLVDAKTKHPLNSSIVIESLGYLPDYNPNSTSNPDQLPVGFVKDTDPVTGDWIGINCAACHTGQVVVDDVAIRIDGAPGMGDYIGLMRTTKASIDYTLNNKRAFKKFSKALKEQDTDTLKLNLQAASEEIAGIIYRDGSELHKGGFGRVDAATAIRNEIFVHDLGVMDNYLTPSAPVSYPALWDTPQYEKVQYPGYAENPFGRNAGQVLGVMGRLDLKNPESFLQSSIRRDNLFYLENWLTQLQPPKWPEQYLGKINLESAERGAVLYAQQDQNGYSCISCHALKDENGQYPLTPAEQNAFGKQFIKTPLTPILIVQTDPNVLLNLYDPRPIQTAQLAPLFGGAQEVSFTTALVTLTKYTVGTLYNAETALSQLEQAAYSGFRFYAPGNSAAPLFSGYLTRPLAGVWATSPYLHNGSVPNLYELLLPADQRSDVFFVGNQQFDTKNVGYQKDEWIRAFEFDTNVSGNSNAGHEFSTHLNDDQRYDLIEFLKTL
ncbi:di-heme-cytochrome C peroxidase [Marinicellulosiphila megalodicopiae]|uniref:di-heme-cytochrome C peroxidase n=1 Tax=Marinicellulosiphila megalodicopiae TaxID=2724896 RepID=UPI003BB0F8BE